MGIAKWERRRINSSIRPDPTDPAIVLVGSDFHRESDEGLGRIRITEVGGYSDSV